MNKHFQDIVNHTGNIIFLSEHTHMSPNALTGNGEYDEEHRKSSIRSKVEHVFRIIKCQFGYKKVVYRGLKKNENRLYALFACANLYSLAIAGRKLSTT